MAFRTDKIGFRSVVRRRTPPVPPPVAPRRDPATLPVTRQPANLRLFVAAYPPPASALAMVTLIEQVAQREPALPRHRAASAGQVHLTLQFIGERRQNEIVGVIESVARAASGIGPITLTPKRLIALPERGPTRLIALETDAPPGLLELHRRLAHRLAKNPREAAGDRFMPHLTLCRFAQPGEFRLDFPAVLPPFTLDRVNLMRSILHPGGAAHEVLYSADLRD